VHLEDKGNDGWIFMAPVRRLIRSSPIIGRCADAVLSAIADTRSTQRNCHIQATAGKD
jgi:hypothetical protein